MICVNSAGETKAAVGGKCPTGFEPMDTTVDAASLVAAILGNTGQKTADGSYVPYQADTRPVALTGEQAGGRGRPMGAPGQSVYNTLQAFKTMKYKDPGNYRKIVNQMRRAGVISDRVVSDASIAEAYETVLIASADLLEQGIYKAPEVLMQELEQGGSVIDMGGPERLGSAAYTGPSSVVDLTNETTAYTLLNTAARDMIGRDLTPDEVRKYTEQLNKIETESARISTPQGPGMTVYGGGVDRDEVVRQLISDNPEFAGYQLNHTIMDTILADIDEGQSFLNEWS